jgi:hypothetical protein
MKKKVVDIYFFRLFTIEIFYLFNLNHRVYRPSDCLIEVLYTFIKATEDFKKKIF